MVHIFVKGVYVKKKTVRTVGLRKQWVFLGPFIPNILYYSITVISLIELKQYQTVKSLTLYPFSIVRKADILFIWTQLM